MRELMGLRNLHLRAADQMLGFGLRLQSGHASADVTGEPFAVTKEPCGDDGLHSRGKPRASWRSQLEYLWRKTVTLRVEGMQFLPTPLRRRGEHVSAWR